jgi:hypothetical protein
MEEHLVGYLLKLLEPETERAVEAWLAGNAEGRQRLEALRRSLAPLAADAGEIEPPPGLALKALATIAQYRTAQRPPAPRPAAPRLPRPTGGGDSWRWPRRADVLAAAGILVLVAGLVASWLTRQWREYQVRACQNNMAQFWQALQVYADRHQGAFPRVQDGHGPYSVAGIFLPLLEETGALASEAVRGCPTTAGRRPHCPPTLQSLELALHCNPTHFRNLAHDLAGGYAYSLGYRENGRLFGLTRELDGNLPILADEPPRGGDGNSPNHSGKGQNVLYLGGHVRFWTTPNAGVDGDDIYRNRDLHISAGMDRYDSVLGAGDASPGP